MSKEVHSQMDLLRATICKEGSEEDVKLFLHICSITGLDPFTKQIYAVFRFDKGSGKKTMNIQTGIDGYRLIAERTGKYMPGREPTFSYDKNGNLFSATSYIKKFGPDGTWHECAATAFWAESAQKNADGKPMKFWTQMPHGQLSKCAESLALRRAFPANMSGLYTSEEMEQADKVETIVVKSEPAIEQIIEQCELITAEQAETIERMIHPDDKEYKSNLLSYFKVDSFAKLPSKALSACMKSVANRTKLMVSEEFKLEDIKDADIPF